MRGENKIISKEENNKAQNGDKYNNEYIGKSETTER